MDEIYVLVFVRFKTDAKDFHIDSYKRNYDCQWFENNSALLIMAIKDYVFFRAVIINSFWLSKFTEIQLIKKKR